MRGNSSQTEREREKERKMKRKKEREKDNVTWMATRNNNKGLEMYMDVIK